MLYGMLEKTHHKAPKTQQKLKALTSLLEGERKEVIMTKQALLKLLKERQNYINGFNKKYNTKEVRKAKTRRFRKGEEMIQVDGEYLANFDGNNYEEIDNNINTLEQAKDELRTIKRALKEGEAYYTNLINLTWKEGTTSSFENTINIGDFLDQEGIDKRAARKFERENHFKNNDLHTPQIYRNKGEKGHFKYSKRVEDLPRYFRLGRSVENWDLTRYLNALPSHLRYKAMELIKKQGLRREIARLEAKYDTFLNQCEKPKEEPKAEPKQVEETPKQEARETPKQEARETNPTSQVIYIVETTKNSTYGDEEQEEEKERLAFHSLEEANKHIEELKEDELEYEEFESEKEDGLATFTNSYFYEVHRVDLLS